MTDSPNVLKDVAQHSTSVERSSDSESQSHPRSKYVPPHLRNRSAASTSGRESASSPRDRDRDRDRDRERPHRQSSNGSRRDFDRRDRPRWVGVTCCLVGFFADACARVFFFICWYD